MTDQARHVQELRNLIASHEVVLVVGTGVSVSATKEAPTASWRGLLLSGVKWCEEMNPALRGRWAERRRDDIEHGTGAEMIAAADLITDALNALAPGEFGKWLEDEVGSLRLKDRSVLEALIALGLPFTTTVNGRPRAIRGSLVVSFLMRMLFCWRPRDFAIRGKWRQIYFGWLSEHDLSDQLTDQRRDDHRRLECGR